jgi:hypothetical protein
MTISQYLDAAHIMLKTLLFTLLYLYDHQSISGCCTYNTPFSWILHNNRHSPMGKGEPILMFQKKHPYFLLKYNCLLYYTFLTISQYLYTAHTMLPSHGYYIIIGIPPWGKENLY